MIVFLYKLFGFVYDLSWIKIFSIYWLSQQLKNDLKK